MLPASWEPAADGGIPQGCCYPIDTTAAVCTGEGLSVVAAGVQTSLLDTHCSNGGELRGFVTDTAPPSLCCTVSR
jgi:hypothetical protein